MNNKVLILIGVALGVIITASVIGGQQMIAQGDLTAAEVMAIVGDNPVFMWNLIKDDANTVISEEINVLSNAAQDLSNTVQSLNNTIDNLESRIASLENRFLIVEATGQVTTSPVSPTTNDYDLTCLIVSGVELLDCEYAQDQIVYIRGTHDTGGLDYKWSIKRGTQTLISQTSSLPSNGQFLFVFNTGGDALLGPYTAVVLIDGKTDVLEFSFK